MGPQAQLDAAPAAIQENRIPIGWPEKLAVAALAIALASALLYQAWHVGVTVDEPSHLVSSYLYWRGADNLPPHDMPPLMKAVGGGMPHLFGLPLEADLGKPGETRHEWDVAAAMMERLPRPEIQRIFFWSRLPMIVFPLLTMLVLWRWARQLFRPWTAVALAAAFAAEPTALAHGALFKNDLASTFGYLLFWFCAWKYWRDPRPLRAAALGGATLLAVISKLSMLFLFGAAPLIVLLRAAAGPRPRRRLIAAALALAVLIPYFGTLAAYQFDTRRLSEFELAAHAKNPHLPGWFVAAAHIFRVVPLARPMWDGVTSLFANDGQHVPVYLLGKVYPHGTPLYFLVALAVKTPVPLQTLLCAGLALAAVGLVAPALHGGGPVLDRAGAALRRARLALLAPVGCAPRFARAAVRAFALRRCARPFQGLAPRAPGVPAGVVGHQDCHRLPQRHRLHEPVDRRLRRTACVTWRTATSTGARHCPSSPSTFTSTASEKCTFPTSATTTSSATSVRTKWNWWRRRGPRISPRSPA